MAEVFVEFSEPVMAKDGRVFVARACGSELDRSLWQGWLEFLPWTGEPPLGPVAKPLNPIGRTPLIGRRA